MYTEQITVLLDLPEPAHVALEHAVEHPSHGQVDVPWVSLVDQSAHHVPAPLDPQENLRYRLLLSDLERGDGDAAASRLDVHGDGFGGAYALLSCYVTSLLVNDFISASGYSLPGGDHLMRSIRHQCRDELARLPSQGTVEWIVPATPGDRTAAHVAALVFTRLGTLSRPWLWASTPDHGRFVILGVTARQNAAADHHRCEGCLTFTEVAERFTHQC